jgi:ribosomal protein S18 acetylase RimI-like enzyme
VRAVLRPARPDDFEFCADLYFAGMDEIVRKLSLDRASQVAGFKKRWDVSQVRIITLDGTDIGWVQTANKDDALFLAQLFVDGAFQRRGIGSEVVEHLIGEATQVGQAMTLGVVKTNPALRLYQRLGFRITHEDDRKLYMRREAR